MEEGEGNPPSSEGSMNEDTLALAQTYEVEYFVTAEPETFDLEHAQQYLPIPNQVQNVNTPVLTSGSECGHQASNISGHEGNSLEENSISVVQLVQPAFHLTGREDQNVERPSSVECPLLYIIVMPYTGQESGESIWSLPADFTRSQESHSNEPTPSTSKQARLMQEKGGPSTSSSDTRTHSQEKRYVCEESGCGKAFSQRCNLEIHTRIHTGEKPSVCKESKCGKAFSQSCALEKHRRIHTGAKPYVCNESGCEKAFSQSYNLETHTRTHTGVKPYVCKESGCGKAFSHSGNLEIHSRTHTGAKPYFCKESGCEKAFSQRSSLENHRRIHTGEKPYVCKELGCGKAFSQRSHLAEHRRTHTGGKPYVCKESGCGKAFSQSSNLEKNRRIHTREKPYVCETCGKRFPWNSELTRHIRTHREDKIDERGAVNETRDTGDTQVATFSGYLVNTYLDNLFHGVQSTEMETPSGQSNDAQDVNNPEEQRGFDLEEDPTDFDADGNLKQDD